MILSMTGFGKAVAQLPDKKITVEIKTLNSRQLDMSTRIPQIFREKDLELRHLAARRLERGKVDMTVYMETITADASVSLNIPVMKAYKAQIEQMGEQLGLPLPDDWYTLLMRFPDSMHSETPSSVDESDCEALTDVVERALDEVMAFREREGAKLADFFALRINRIRELLAEVPRWETERVAKIRARIEDGLAKISPVDYDKSRLEQEMIFYIEKLDINEEKQRLAQHLNYFMETLEAPVPGQGKKLGFISQEMGREINTLGSKSNHAEMQKLVVMMKDELEQIKEQVLNVM